MISTEAGYQRLLAHLGAKTENDLDTDEVEGWRVGGHAAVATQEGARQGVIETIAWDPYRADWYCTVVFARTSFVIVPIGKLIQSHDPEKP
ncbi:MAG: hypothetical protein M0R06_04725 [Sphaerochaeta sp.]|jgi:hypothetical protein|nr:hypothetical protein [Sphaerochaeta sp.]